MTEFLRRSEPELRGRDFSAAKALPEPHEPGLYQRFGKRAFDLVAALALLVIFSPIFLVTAFLVVLDGGKPFFGHRRIGRHGQSFHCLKFRSMVPNAEQRLSEVLARDPEAQRQWDENCKLERDPRITRIGGFLRRSSMDELPQLLNVLRGEMSLVGPRPVTADELERYGHVRELYKSLRPGMTGRWQVHGRSRVGYEDRVLMDAEYARSVGLSSDLGLLMRTAGVVLARSGQ